ncbi:TPA: hypothetical protein ACIRVE_005079 [Pseudomonas putida]
MANPSDVILPLTLHLDQPTVAAINRYRTARAAHQEAGHSESTTSADLFVAYQWAAFDLATAVDELLSKRTA